MTRHLADIFNKVSEDDYSYLKLAKEIGRITYILHKNYKSTFNKVENTIAKFYKQIITKKDDG